MTIDERLDRLTQLNESLAQRLETLTHDVHELTHDVRELRAAIEADAQSVRALARIAEVHDRRFTGMEGAPEAWKPIEHLPPPLPKQPAGH
jgi:chromosome segregation ATPase